MLSTIVVCPTLARNIDYQASTGRVCCRHANLTVTALRQLRIPMLTDFHGTAFAGLVSTNVMSIRVARRRLCRRASGSRGTSAAVKSAVIVAPKNLGIRLGGHYMTEYQET